MLTIFNRRELLLHLFPGNTGERPRRAKRGGIAYRLRVRNLTSAVGRSYPAGTGLRPSVRTATCSTNTFFYVHRDDVAEAAGILAREGIRLH